MDTLSLLISAIIHIICLLSPPLSHTNALSKSKIEQEIKVFEAGNFTFLVFGKYFWRAKLFLLIVLSVFSSLHFCPLPRNTASYGKACNTCNVSFILIRKAYIKNKHAKQMNYENFLSLFRNFIIWTFMLKVPHQFIFTVTKKKKKISRPVYRKVASTNASRLIRRLVY